MDIIQHQFFTVKECGVCHQVKSSDAFYKHCRSRDGLQSHCKDCTRAIKNTHARLHREELRAAARAYREKNPDKGLAYRQKVKDQLRVRWARWQKQNPERNAIRSLRYLARKRGAVGDYTFVEWNDLCAQHNYRCLCCGKSRKLTADHIIPLSKGGANTIDNIQPLCQPCNSAKGTKTTDYR